MVKAKLSEPEVKAKGWLLDGFPRTAAQAKAMADIGIKADAFVQLEVPDSVLVERICLRRTDPVTGKIYHLKFNPPPADVVSRLVKYPLHTLIRTARFQSVPALPIVLCSYEHAGSPLR
jgi:adenylate kinase